ncbi:PAS domain S-box protein [Hymenobacter sp. BT186]|uniref:histidine kinase n=1 Tax=Hymenobacter telluris TaxID=2816474 RepID=A0A939ESB3_9BACT|nr:PAS domain S-box protein [Hymenobacter telluris]MBO0356879.1 PAS domain S-box protein [Hymenobacter telluris]MBW3372906.1 PAS domain S-box protein [Hymenobacter norwichensis]
MTSIAYRQQQRQLRQARSTQRTAQLQLQELREQLRQQRESAAGQLQALLQTMSAGILAQDEHLRTMLVNQRFCELLGLQEPAGKYVGTKSAELLSQAIPFAKPAETRQQIEDARATQTRQTHLVALANNKILQCEYLPMVQEGRTVLHLWSYEDVTQQQRILSRVRELSQLAESSPEPIICFSKDGQARYANPAAGPVLHTLAQPQWQAEQEFLRREVAYALAAATTRTVERGLNGHHYLWTVVPLPDEDAANVYLTDITARRQAEKELHHSQLFAARINDTIPAIVFLFDVQEMRIVYANQQVERIMGYTEQQLLAFGSNIVPQLLDEAGQQQLEGLTERLVFLTDEQNIEYELRIRHQHGGWRWLKIQGSVFMRDADGTIRQMVGSAEDITERKATEDSLRQIRMLQDRVANTVPNLIYIYDYEKQRNVYCNRYIETITGYSRHEILAMGAEALLSLMPESEAEKLRQHVLQMKEAADGEIVTMEYHLTHVNGSVRWLRITTTPFERDSEGRVRQIVGTAEDITRWKVADEQRRTANRRLAEQNRLFRQVIDTTPHLIYLKDSQDHYLLANRATAELYGMTPAQIVNTQLGQRPVSLADSQRYRLQDEQVIRTGQEMAQEETFTRPDGTILWFHSIKRPFVLADGSVQVLGIDSNITELKRTQLDLRAAKEAAEENAQAKQNFLANMSHEIRTPLNGILGIAGLLAKTPLDDQQSQYLDHIRHSADHLLVVINDVLAMSQLSAGKVRTETIAFDLRDVLQASRESLLPRAQEKGISLTLTLPSPNVSTTVLGDPYRLRQILLNLLSNAVKFTERGQVLLACQPLSNSPDEQQLFQFTVRDTGPGIPAHQIQEMFEPFTQASASTAREYGGSGLGLSISRNLVELMGGTMSAESQLNEGSTFSFTLPFKLTTPATRPELPAQPIDYRALGPRRVLLAEDNAINQFLVESLVRNWGWTVDTAGTGPKALALFGQQTYDVVLMDIQMPGMDGITATRLLRQHPDAARAATPILALTAHALRGEEEQYLEAGFSGYLSKPFREEELFQAIGNILGQRTTVQAGSAGPAVTEEDAVVSSPLYSLSGIRRLAHGNEEFVRRLAQLFIQTAPPAVQDLEQYTATGDYQQLATSAHSLKSSLDGLHIRQLHTPIRRLEACRDTPLPLPEIEELVALVRAVTAQVIAGLRQDFPGL